MREIYVLLLVACRAQPAPLPASKVGSIDAWVLDRDGRVADAEVRIVSLSSATCACKPKPDDGMGFENSVPECSCPEQLAAYRTRFASCTWPTPASAVLRSDAAGHVPLDVRALGAAVEATTPAGAKWLTLPERADRIALEVVPATRWRFVTDNTSDLRAVLLFDDGHCLPFQREDATAWVTVAPVPKSDEWPVLVVEAPGFAPIVRAWYESDEELALALHRAQSVTGACPGDRVELTNPLQHIVVKPDHNGFSIDGALDLQSQVTCFKSDDVVEEWLYSPEDGLEGFGGVLMGGGRLGGACHDVVVLDRAGRPIAGAEISFDHQPDHQFSHGSTGAATGTQGRACVQDLHEGGELIVAAPFDHGGTCAGEVKLRVTAQHMTKPAITVRLDVEPLRRERYRGRVLSPERLPVAGARIAVRDVSPSADCSTRTDVAVTTGSDGRFELPLLPVGDLALDIQHAWYAQRAITVANPGREREIMLERGLTWKGRVLDPEGEPIEHCQLVLTLPSQRSLYADCRAGSFAFSTIAAGESEVKVIVKDHPLGAYRALEQKITITKSLREDIRWPIGDTIAGRVVDPGGTPIAGARLTAVPKGTFESVSQRAPGEVMLEADGDGRFVFRYLAPGVWTIRGDRRAKQQITIDIKTPATDVEIVTAR
jgi:hypothetical protein